jgi:hypothetical protein
LDQSRLLHQQETIVETQNRKLKMGFCKNYLSNNNLYTCNQRIWLWGCFSDRRKSVGDWRRSFRPVLLYSPCWFYSCDLWRIQR